RVLYGVLGETAVTFGRAAKVGTVMRFFLLSRSRFLYGRSCKPGPWVPTSRVYPSAGALTAYLVPMVPPAPGRLLTMTGCPRYPASLSAMMRPMRSTVPPGAKGTTSVMGLLG